MKNLCSRVLSCFNYTVPRIYGKKGVFIPHVMGIKVGISGEAWMLDILRKLLPGKSGSFIDVGVNLGQTLIKVKTIEPDRDYIGFEPNPVCVTYVNRLIQKNGFKNCTLVPVGLFPETTILGLNLYQPNSDDSSASMIAELRPTHEIKKTIFVPVSTFEATSDVIGIEKIGIVKVDVEGAELEVFQTMVGAIKKDRPLILVEILPVEKGEGLIQLERQKAIEQIFSDLGYQFFQIRKTVKRRFTGLERIHSLSMNRDIQLRDYLLVPEEIVHEVSSRCCQE